MTRLRIATLNLQNLQLPNEVVHPRMRPFTSAEFDRKLEWLGAMVQRLDADILGLQELWAPRALRFLFERIKLHDEYTLVMNGPANAKGTELSVALAVRKGCTTGPHVWIKQFPTEFALRKRAAPPPAPDYEMAVQIERFSRPFLRCEVRPPQGDPILVHVVHLKSRLAIDLDGEEANDGGIRRHARTLGDVLSTVRRAAEAGALRVYLEQATLSAARPLVLMGDINDSLGSATHAILTGDPSPDPHARVPASYRPEAALWPVTDFNDRRGPAALRPTYVFDGRYDTLDHIFVSAHFHPHARTRQWRFKELRVLNDHLDERRNDDAARILSDHGALVAEFGWDPAS